MKTTNQHATGPGAAPDVRCVFPPAVPCRGTVEAQLEDLKERLLKPVVAAVANTALAREIRWAANEAAALAWYSACPVLILPALLEEKVIGACGRWEKQQQVLGAQA
jgi:hypothetical protein